MADSTQPSYRQASGDFSRSRAMQPGHVQQPVHQEQDKQDTVVQEAPVVTVQTQTAVSAAPETVTPAPVGDAQTAAQPPVQQPAQVSVSGGSKEQGPVMMPAAKENEEDDEKPVVAAQEQVVTASVPEVVLPKEVAPHVEHGPDAKEHKIDETVKQAGVSLTKEAAPVITEPTLPFTLPMKYQEAKQLRKTAKFKDAVKWVAALVLYNLKKANPEVYK